MTPYLSLQVFLTAGLGHAPTKIVHDLSKSVKNSFMPQTLHHYFSCGHQHLSNQQEYFAVQEELLERVELDVETDNKRVTRVLLKTCYDGLITRLCGFEVLIQPRTIPCEDGQSYRYVYNDIYIRDVITLRILKYSYQICDVSCHESLVTCPSWQQLKMPKLDEWFGNRRIVVIEFLKKICGTCKLVTDKF